MHASFMQPTAECERHKVSRPAEPGRSVPVRPRPQGRSCLCRRDDHATGGGARRNGAASSTRRQHRSNRGAATKSRRTLMKALSCIVAFTMAICGLVSIELPASAAAADVTEHVGSHHSPSATGWRLSGHLFRRLTQTRDREYIRSKRKNSRMAPIVKGMSSEAAHRGALRQFGLGIHADFIAMSTSARRQGCAGTS